MAITTIAALNEGARRVLQFPRLILLFYFANLAVAGVIIVPAAFIIGQRLSHSLDNERLYSNLDPAFIIETINQLQLQPLSAMAATTVLLAGLYLLMTTFLAGGTIAVLNRDEVPFFSSCAKYFPRLLRLLLISLLFYGIILALHDTASTALAQVRESLMEARTPTILHWLQLVVEFLLFSVVNMLFDYAKVVCVVREERSAVRAMLTALGFVLRKPGSTLAVYWLCSGIGLAFLLAYYGIAEVSGQQSGLAVALIFILRQLYMLVRMWLRLWTWSSELHLYTFSSTIVAPDPPSLAVAG